MFIKYNNDLSSISNDHVKCFMYADDLAVQISCKYSSLANHLLFKINSIIIEDWKAANSLYVNNNKTHNIIIT